MSHLLAHMQRQLVGEVNAGHPDGDQNTNRLVSQAAFGHRRFIQIHQRHRATLVGDKKSWRTSASSKTVKPQNRASSWAGWAGGSTARRWTSARSAASPARSGPPAGPLRSAAGGRRVHTLKEVEGNLKKRICL